MKPYNIEIFNRTFELLAHTNVDDVSIDYDYLKPNDSKITVRLSGFYDMFIAQEPENDVDEMMYHTMSVNVPELEGLMDQVGVGAYIRLQRDDTNIFGVITSITSADDKLLTTLGIQPFPAAIFSTEIMFDTNVQGVTALETVIANIITANWISNSDTLQNIPNLSVVTTTSTTAWGMALKSDTEGMHHCIINFYDTLIRRAIEEYGIAIQTSVDFKENTIVLTIGKVSETQTIEADLPNVFERTFMIHESSKNTNKLVVYDTTNYTSTRTYYKHSDGTYSRVNTDRIYPVVREVNSADSDESNPFAQAADSVAASVFGEITYNNLIEITCSYEDKLIKPSKIKVGTVVSIIHENKAYTSILTGYKLSENVITLIFGSVRADLTKLIGG